MARARLPWLSLAVSHFGYSRRPRSYTSSRYNSKKGPEVKKAQPQYIIEARACCKTHRPGSRITYTGPRGNTPNGWRIIKKA